MSLHYPRRYSLRIFASVTNQSMPRSLHFQCHHLLMNQHPHWHHHLPMNQHPPLHHHLPTLTTHVVSLFLAGGEWSVIACRDVIQPGINQLLIAFKVTE